MKFCKCLSAEAIPEWRGHYINYKALKKLVKARMFESLCRTDDILASSSCCTDEKVCQADVDLFVQGLQPEVLKVHEFFSSQVSIEMTNMSDLEAAVSVCLHTALCLSRCPPSLDFALGFSHPCRSRSSGSLTRITEAKHAAQR